MRRLLKWMFIALAVVGVPFTALLLLGAVWVDSQPATFIPQPLAVERVEQVTPAEALWAPVQPFPSSELATTPATWFSMTLLVFGAGLVVLMLGFATLLIIFARRRSGGSVDAGEEQLMRELHERAARMESRLESLETLLLERHQDEWAARS